MAHRSLPLVQARLGEWHAACSNHVSGFRRSFPDRTLCDQPQDWRWWHVGLRGDIRYFHSFEILDLSKLPALPIQEKKLDFGRFSGALVFKF